MNSGYAIQCSSSSASQRRRNALRRWRGRELTNTTRAPAARAARSCAVRPALSKTTTRGRNSRISAHTSRVWKVGEAGSRVEANGVAAA